MQICRDHESENQVHRFSIRRIELDRLAEFYQRANTAFEALDATMWKCDALIEAGTTESFTFNQAFEYILTGDMRMGPHEKFTEYLEAVLLAAGVRIAQDTIGFDYFFEQHLQ